MERVENLGITVELAFGGGITTEFDGDAIPTEEGESTAVKEVFVVDVLGPDLGSNASTFSRSPRYNFGSSG